MTLPYNIIKRGALYIALALSITLLSCSCGKTRISYAVRGEFRYYNRLNNPIKITVRNGMTQAFASYDVATGDSVVFVASASIDEDQPADPLRYVPGIASDTTTIRFNDTLCYIEYNKTGEILHNIKTHSYVKRGDRNYLFFFDIDSNLLKLGKKCP